MLKPASMFTDGAVLCREKEIKVFGRVGKGREVTVSLRDAEGRLLAVGRAREADGRFLALLPPQKAQRGCTLTMESGEEVRRAEDVAIGDVYLAGGQSNMELELRNADEGSEVMAAYEDADLRFFNVPKQAVVGAAQRQAVDAARWEAIAPGKGGSNSAVAYFFAAAIRKAHPEVPVGIIDCYWGGTSVTCWMPEETLKETAEGARYLKENREKSKGITMEAYLEAEKAFLDRQERWYEAIAAFKADHPRATWQETTATCGICEWNPPAGPGSPYRPAGLAESMLKETVPAALTGFLYYQGEEDTWRTEKYDLLMIQLIRCWRGLFQDAALPFLFVQLPMWLDEGAEDGKSWARLRLAQAAARDAVRGSGMICLLDEGEFGNIHPTAKRVVGERLAELAKAEIYGEPGAVSPRAVGRTVSGDTLTVRLSAPVLTRDGQAPRLLEIAEADGSFVPACAAVTGREIRLWAKGVTHPVHARYAWTDYSDAVNLFGENGLPLEPFRL